MFAAEEPVGDARQGEYIIAHIGTLAFEHLATRIARRRETDRFHFIIRHRWLDVQPVRGAKIENPQIARAR